MRESIPDDATIADIVNTLLKPIEYVRKVSEPMWDCEREHGSASVRIGTLGGGRAPNYLIEYVLQNTRQSKVYGAYYGLGHKAMENFDTTDRVRLEPIADRTLMREHWSTRVMSRLEISELLLSLRKRRR